MAEYKVNVEDIESVLVGLGGKAKVGEIKDGVTDIFCAGVKPDNYKSKTSFRETIQRKIEDYCPESSNFDESKREPKFRRVSAGVYELIGAAGAGGLIDVEVQRLIFSNKVNASLADLPSARKSRLLSAGKIPKKIKAFSEIFDRNPDVVAEVLLRANGLCEHCKKPAPFMRKKDGSPYLEVHHKIKLADGGEDTVENAMGICPNCHRQLHFGV